MVYNSLLVTTLIKMSLVPPLPPPPPPLPPLVTENIEEKVDDEIEKSLIKWHQLVVDSETNKKYFHISMWTDTPTILQQGPQ